MSLERYVPEHPFPAYAFVPGCHPHPVNDPKGHSFGIPSKSLLPFDPGKADTTLDYLYAIDLFNAGYYWEAHEEWEALWTVSGRTGRVADFLKGLIKLAAAGVKSREGQRNGVVRHAKRAGELFRQIEASTIPELRSFAGLSLMGLIECADRLAQTPIVDTTPSTEGRPVLEFHLCLEGREFLF